MRLANKQSRDSAGIPSVVTSLIPAFKNIIVEQHLPPSSRRPAIVPSKKSIPLADTGVSNGCGLVNDCESEKSSDATTIIRQLLESLSEAGATLPGYQDILAESTARAEQLLYQVGGSASLLSVEHPLVMTYVSSCQEDIRMIYVSPQIANLGYAPEKYLGKTDIRLQQAHESDSEMVGNALRHSLRTGKKFNCQYRLYDSAGKVRWIHDEASVVCDDAGVPMFIKGIMLDITDKKHMEEELRQHRYHLDQHIEQRTERLMKRIAVLESCNAVLCSKLRSVRQGEPC
ncbi:MAG: PAS domain-containing protein [Nitrosomonadales bacterium]|nr:PAS domain-containing protein [Nitrosomonadales bacterium]